jgi:hypothetical protein
VEQLERVIIIFSHMARSEMAHVIGEKVWSGVSSRRLHLCPSSGIGFRTSDAPVLHGAIHLPNEIDIRKREKLLNYSLNSITSFYDNGFDSQAHAVVMRVV